MHALRLTIWLLVQYLVVFLILFILVLGSLPSLGVPSGCVRLLLYQRARFLYLAIHEALFLLAGLHFTAYGIHGLYIIRLLKI